MTKVITIFSCANDLHKIAIIRWRIGGHARGAPTEPRAVGPDVRGSSHDPNVSRRCSLNFPLASGTIPNASKADRQREWKDLEPIYATGEARSIGVSHCCS